MKNMRRLTGLEYLMLMEIIFGPKVEQMTEGQKALSNIYEILCFMANMLCGFSLCKFSFISIETFKTRLTTS